MDITLLLGIGIGFFLIIIGIGFGQLRNFWDLSSIIITVGGTFAALLASFKLSTILEIPKHFKIILQKNKNNPAKYIEILYELSQEGRKNGLLALESKAREQDDEFLKESLMLIVDAVDADKVRELLENELDYLDTRHAATIAFYKQGSALAPAFGMIGTLIGLIIMLKSMGADSANAAANLGNGMSVALVTTFYGTILSNLIFLPIAKKLKTRHEEEMLCKEIIVEGVLSIQSGENPRFIQEKLLGFLSEKSRTKHLEKTGQSE